MERRGRINLDLVTRSKMLGMSASTSGRLLRDTKSVTCADRLRRNMLELHPIVPVRESDHKRCTLIGAAIVRREQNARFHRGKGGHQGLIA